MTKNLKWRLSKLPTADELRELVKDKIITQEEARNILFNEIEDNERDNESLKEEIKFLREMVSKLSSRSTIVETIPEVYKPYQRWDWYKPYEIWCTNTVYSGSGGNTYVAGNSTATLLNGTSSITNLSSTNLAYDNSADSFSLIATF